MGNRPVKIKGSDRLNLVKEYYFSKKLREVADMNARGENVISLAIGSPDRAPSDATIDKLCEVAKDPKAHGYQSSISIPELRNAIAAYYKRIYGVDINPDKEILPLIGSKEGILHITLAFVNPDDKVLIPDPGYPAYSSLSKILGADVVNFNLLSNHDWQPDFSQIERMDLSQVKLLWVNYPNMPTGGNAEIKTFERLVKLAHDHNFVIVNDNPYSLILNSRPLSIMEVDGAKEVSIELNSMSKSHNMPGWRVGMCISNPEFISWILKIKSNVDSGTFRGIQMGAAQALSNSDEWHQLNNIEVYSRRRKLAEEIMSLLDCSFNSNQVGMFLWGKIPDKYTDASQITDKLLYEARVFITPGFIFGENGRRYIRISLCGSEDSFKTAIQRIKNINF